VTTLKTVRDGSLTMLALVDRVGSTPTKDVTALIFLLVLKYFLLTMAHAENKKNIFFRTFDKNA